MYLIDQIKLEVAHRTAQVLLLIQNSTLDQIKKNILHLTRINRNQSTKTESVSNGSTQTLKERLTTSTQSEKVCSRSYQLCQSTLGSLSSPFTPYYAPASPAFC